MKKSIDITEQQRAFLQIQLDNMKSMRERNKLGQYSTPAKLASEILSYAHKLLPTTNAIRFLDPAIGTGVFYSALLERFANRSIETALGYEIDETYEQSVSELWSDYSLHLRFSDFTTAEVPRDEQKYNLIICNPPYCRHHHLGAAKKKYLSAATLAASGMQLSGLSGFYCYFIGLSHLWMAPDCVAGWLLPSEFMDVNYGGPVKQYLLERVELIRVHRFDPSDLQFEDALVSSVIVWFRMRKPKPGHMIEFSFGGTLAKPEVSRLISADLAKNTMKWTSISITGPQEVSRGLRLKDLFEIKRGLATGDNQFFLMTRAQIIDRDLPMRFFKPILPSPRYVESDIIESNEDGIPKLAHQLFILDCRLPEEMVRNNHPELYNYLRSGLETVAKRYLCNHRTPWYLQENRPPALFVCTYMGRYIEARANPFRFLLNYSQATATNVYLLLYPKAVLARILVRDPGMSRLVWNFLCSIETRALIGEGRVYGGGLYKLEPKELGNVSVDEIRTILPDLYAHSRSQTDLFDVDSWPLAQ